MANLLQPWPETTDIPIESVYQRAQTAAAKYLPQFKSLLEPFVLPGCNLLTNIKSLSSFIRKAKCKPVRRIHDVLRAAILTQTKEQAEEIANKLKPKTIEFDQKNDPDEATTGYYGSFHLKLKIGDMICEVQIMPETLWVYKERNHPIYANSEKDPSVLSFSRWLYDTANKESA